MILEMDENFYHPSRLNADVMVHLDIGVQMIDAIDLGAYILHANKVFVVNSPQVATINQCL
jgi:hypothetical protein